MGHIAQACARGEADSAARQGPLDLPNLISLGLAEACRLATGHTPPVLAVNKPAGRFGCAAEISKGKDTPSGHWELAGVPVAFDWGYFPRTSPCFPDAIVSALCRRARLPGILGNCHASGTEIITRLGVGARSLRNAHLLHIGRQRLPDCGARAAIWIGAAL